MPLVLTRRVGEANEAERALEHRVTKCTQEAALFLFGGVEKRHAAASLECSVDQKERSEEVVDVSGSAQAPRGAAGWSGHENHALASDGSTTTAGGAVRGSVGRSSTAAHAQARGPEFSRGGHGTRARPVGDRDRALLAARAIAGRARRRFLMPSRSSSDPKQFVQGAPVLHVADVSATASRCQAVNREFTIHCLTPALPALLRKG
jgi:hypothetical protein